MQLHFSSHDNWLMLVDWTFTNPAVKCVTEWTATIFIFFRPVKVIKFISKDSVEESMFKVAQDKLNLEQQVTGGGNGMVNLII